MIQHMEIPVKRPQQGEQGKKQGGTMRTALSMKNIQVAKHRHTLHLSLWHYGKNSSMSIPTTPAAVSRLPP